MEHFTSQKRVHFLFLRANGIFTKIKHILGYNMNVSKLKIIKILQSMFTDYNTVNIEMDNKKTSGKFLTI